jgi:hypothetical protein
MMPPLAATPQSRKGFLDAHPMVSDKISVLFRIPVLVNQFP